MAAIPLSACCIKMQETKYFFSIFSLSGIKVLTLPNETAPLAAFVDTVREDGNILLERKVMTIVIVWLYLNWTDF